LLGSTPIIDCTELEEATASFPSDSELLKNGEKAKWGKGEKGELPDGEKENRKL
jgi:hypothetical protein